MSKHFPSKEEMKMMIPMEKNKNQEEKKPKRQLKATDFEDPYAGYCISLTNQLSYLFWAAMIRDEGKKEDSLKELERKKSCLVKYMEEVRKPNFDLESFRKKMWAMSQLKD